MLVDHEYVYQFFQLGVNLQHELAASDLYLPSNHLFLWYRAGTRYHSNSVGSIVHAIHSSYKLVHRNIIQNQNTIPYTEASFKPTP